MKKLIELDEAIKVTWKDTGYIDPVNVMTAIRDRLEALPTVDAVPVVRCKDCMHYGFTDNRIPEEQVWWCYFWDDVRSPDAYCSDGEREDGDHHD